MSTFSVTNRHHTTLTLQKVLLTPHDVPAMLHLQENVCAQLPSSEWFAPATREEFESFLEGTSQLIGYKTLDGELIALGIYGCYHTSAHNYGHDLGIPASSLHTVGQIECTIVAPSHRGFKLQQHLCIDLETYAHADHMALLTATVFPENNYSLDTFLACGFKVMCEKIKYGGMRRYVLAKSLI